MAEVGTKSKNFKQNLRRTDIHFEICVSGAEQEEQVENERNVRAERFKLPPIFQAATRPKNRTVDKSEGLVRGQKARTFEQEKPSRSFAHLDVEREQKSQARTVKNEAKSPRKDVLAKEGRVQLKPLEKVQRKNNRQGKSLEADLGKKLDLDKDLYIVDTNKDVRKAKSEKTKRRHRAKSKSPQKILPSFESLGVVSTMVEKAGNARSSVDGETPSPPGSEKSPSDNKAQHSDIHGVSSKDVEAFTLSEGDMVAIRVPEKLYIRGQPCLGKITTLADHQGLLTVHYYTGSYEGRWRPMMSRTSPYLRKVNTANVLWKFKLSSDGRMSPITQRKLRTVVDDERNESGDTM